MWTRDLTDTELTVLDLAMSYFTDTVRKVPDTLPRSEQHAVLRKLHDDVLERKRNVHSVKKRELRVGPFTFTLIRDKVYE